MEDREGAKKVILGYIMGCGVFLAKFVIHQIDEVAKIIIYLFYLLDIQNYYFFKELERIQSNLDNLAIQKQMNQAICKSNSWCKRKLSISNGFRFLRFLNFFYFECLARQVKESKERKIIGLLLKDSWEAKKHAHMEFDL